MFAGWSGNLEPAEDLFYDFYKYEHTCAAQTNGCWSIKLTSKARHSWQLCQQVRQGTLNSYVGATMQVLQERHWMQSWSKLQVVSLLGGHRGQEQSMLDLWRQRSQKNWMQSQGQWQQQQTFVLRLWFGGRTWWWKSKCSQQQSGCQASFSWKRSWWFSCKLNNWSNLL